MAYTHGESQESRRNPVDSRNKLSRVREREMEATMHRRLNARGTRGCTPLRSSSTSDNKSELRPTYSPRRGDHRTIFYSTAAFLLRRVLSLRIIKGHWKRIILLKHYVLSSRTNRLIASIHYLLNVSEAM